MVDPSRLELETSAMSMLRSNQLSYGSKRSYVSLMRDQCCAFRRSRVIINTISTRSTARTSLLLLLPALQKKLKPLRLCFRRNDDIFANSLLDFIIETRINKR